jgi:hypothetical protein
MNEEFFFCCKVKEFDYILKKKIAIKQIQI